MHHLWSPFLHRIALAILVFPALISGAAWTQDDQAEAGAEPKVGFVIQVPVPLETADANRIVTQLTQLSESTPEGKRVTVVLRYAATGATGSSGDETQFEDALKLARAMASDELRRVRVVSLVQGEVSGHSTLPIIASDMLLVQNGGIINNAGAGESRVDETISSVYQSVARRRGLFPPPIIAALIDQGVELARVTKTGGEQLFAAGDELANFRKTGALTAEDVWSNSGVPLQLDANQLRDARVAAPLVGSLEEVAERLDLAELNPIDQQSVAGEAKGVLLEITGSIADGRTRRWQSNLTGTLSNDVNTWVIAIDSGGGSLDDSATLAGWFSQPTPPLQQVVGLIRNEARGDSALIALACKPLYMKPEARIGGPGADSISAERLAAYDELIDQVAAATKRPAALIRGLLDPTAAVYRYTNRKTGRVRYATEDDIVAAVANPEAEKEKWIQGELIDLGNGLSSSEAMALGLIDGESRSVEDTSRRAGLSGTPPRVTDRGLVRFVEKLGRSTSLAFILLFVGFSCLSAEANAPGLGVPGFLAMVCFGLWFWISFLAGTAEWLELVVFGLGIFCIALEVFVVPGMGIFGIGGLALTLLGVVLMSQTFVIPRNAYQLQVLSRGIWMALGGAGGLVGGFVAMRLMLPHVPLLRGLVMEPNDEQAISESEKLGDYSHLAGQSGTTTTPLRPSGKARFGDQIVQVVSDGTAIPSGDPVRVTEVHGTKVVVEPVENG
ncbi:MAG: nodulation protein NfeD [Rubripirellula sp.]